MASSGSDDNNHMPKSESKKIEFGDFQTPFALACEVCELLSNLGAHPASVVEPTCGLGSLLISAAQIPGVQKAIGVDINPDYLESTLKAAQEKNLRQVQLQLGDFFATNWTRLLDDLPDPLLVIGNPPWVTNSALGTLGSDNLPSKSNLHNHRGLDAITGKANFDISEWMLIRILEACNERDAWVAMLLKTTTARKVLRYAWKKRLHLDWAEMRLIDAEHHFGASVSACLLLARFSPGAISSSCRVFQDLHGTQTTSIGYDNGRMLADVLVYQQWKHLEGNSPYIWRSGVKHDCARILEVRPIGSKFVNGDGEAVDLEKEYLYPMLKTSEIASGKTSPSRWMLVTQKNVADDTKQIARTAPLTWKYLQAHAEALDRRGSSIYRNRPSFSVFGVGKYTFSPWKVAVSGFYKHLSFRVIGSHAGHPIVLDDASYLIPCECQGEATLLADLLNGSIAQEFYKSFIFWDAKRPITSEILRRLDLMALARQVGVEEQLQRHVADNKECRWEHVDKETAWQPQLF